MIAFPFGQRAMRKGWRPLIGAMVVICIQVHAAWSIPDYGNAPRGRAEAPAARDCDTELVRMQAVRSVPQYEVDSIHADRGIVTVLFIDRHGADAFAIAMRASGTRIITSSMGVAIGQVEMARAVEPVTLWWTIPDVQQALKACSQGAPDTALGDVEAALHTAAEAALAEHAHGLEGVPRRAALLLGSAWIAFALLIFSAGLSPFQDGVSKRTLFALFGFTLILHWLLSSGGPGDLRLNLAPIWWPTELELRWGPAPVALFRLLALVLGHVHDTQIIWCNLVLSSLLPILLYGILAALGLSPTAAVLAAFVFAIHPLLIQFSGVLERQPTYLFAALGSILAAIRFLQRGGVRPITTFILGTALATLSRPEGAHVLAVDVAILLFTPATRRNRVFFACAVALLALSARAYIQYGLTADLVLRETNPMTFGDVRSLLWTIVLSRDYTPSAWIAAWTAGLLLGIRRRAAWIAIAILAILHLTWTATGIYGYFVGYDRWVSSARYQSILFLPFAIGMALFFDACMVVGARGRGFLAILFVVSTAATLRRPYDTLLVPFAVDYEYRFIRQMTLGLPPDSRVYVVPSADDVGLVDARYVGHFIGSPVHFELWSPHVCDAPDAVADTYIYLGPSCAPIVDTPASLQADYISRMHDCEVIRNHVAADAVAEVDVPARRMAMREFKEPTIRLGLYRLNRGLVCTPSFVRSLT